MRRGAPLRRALYAALAPTRLQPPGDACACSQAAVRPPPAPTGGSHSASLPLLRVRASAELHTTTCASSWSDSATAATAAVSSASDAVSSLSEDTLLVEVVTGDVRGAGCTAPASLTLFGDKGESDELELNHTDDSAGFLPGQVTRVQFTVDTHLGALRTLRVRLREEEQHQDVSAASGWYLEEVRVTRRSSGEAFRFLARRWLGHSDAGGAAFPLEHEVDVLHPGGGASHGGADGTSTASSVSAGTAQLYEEPAVPAPAVPLTRPLTIRTGAAAVPHPDKMRAGARGIARQESGHAGEDAYFVASSPARRQEGDHMRPGWVVLGVADGVYAWRDQGIDAGAFSRALCAAAAAEATAPTHGDCSPLRLMQTAYREVIAAGVQGSCTACFVCVDPTDGLVRSANVGDSGYLLMTPRRAGNQRRPQPAGATQATWQPGGVKYRSPHQEHEFGRPYQLGHWPNSDKPEDAMLHGARLCAGDVLVIGTDGVWDNLHDSEVAAAVQAGVDSNVAPAAIARAVAAAAFERSTLKRGSTPYSLAASEAHDLVFSGGKRDDISVIVMLADG